MTPQERRRGTRREYQTPAIIYPRDPTEKPIRGKVLNVSEEGLALQTDIKLTAGQAIEVEFLPPLSGDLIRVRAEVRYIKQVTQISQKKGKESFCWSGIRMIEPSSALRETIRRFTTSALKEIHEEIHLS